MPATVIVDVFSGLPNPQWTVAGDLLVQLQLLLSHLSQLQGVLVPEPPGLGYRGLMVQFSPGEGMEGPLRVWGGYIIGPRGTFLDAGHALERWLLQTGAHALDPDLLKEILSELR